MRQSGWKDSQSMVFLETGKICICSRGASQSRALRERFCMILLKLIEKHQFEEIMAARLSRFFLAGLATLVAR